MNTILAESNNFLITNIFETTYLIKKHQCNSKNRIIIGTFYGDPQTAIIDKEEKWCAIAGEGLIIYFLRDPFSSYKENQVSSQFFSKYKNESNIKWIQQLVQLSANQILITDDNHQKSIFNIEL